MTVWLNKSITITNWFIQRAVKFLKLVLCLGFFLILFPDSSVLANNKQQGSLQVWLDIEQVKLSRQSIDRYKRILSQVFKLPTTFNTEQSDNTNIIITSRSGGLESGHWIKSELLIDTLPSFSLITLTDKKSSQQPLTGAVRRPYVYKTAGQVYMLDDMNVALKLLKNKRLDSILDYTKESSYYLFDTPTLQQTKLSEAQEVYIYFKNQQMMTQFEQGMEGALIGLENGSNLSENLELNKNALAPSEQPLLIGKNKLKLFLIRKRYNAQSNQLEVTQSDIKTTNWLKKILPDFSFEVSQSNISTAYDTLTKSAHSCILNISKSAEREVYATYSLPTFVYLNYRIYVKSNSDAYHSITSGLKNAKDKGVLDLQPYFDVHQEGLVAYFGYIDRTSSYKDVIQPLVNNHPARFLNLKPEDSERGIQMLEKGRIDYLIAYPFAMEDRVEAFPFIRQFISFSFQRYTRARPVYLACSKSNLGNEVMQKLNMALKQEQSRERFFNLIFESMIDSDKQAVKKFLYQYYD